MSDKNNNVDFEARSSWLESPGRFSMIKLSSLPRSRKDRLRVARGVGSGMGKTARRGGKGQTARAGVSGVRAFEGGQTPLHRRLPKRGFVSEGQKKNNTQAVSIDTIIRLIASGSLTHSIKKSDMVACGLIKNLKIKVKLIGSANIGLSLEKMHIEIDSASDGVKSLISSFGGEVVVLNNVVSE